jgi:hypothetical protein
LAKNIDTTTDFTVELLILIAAGRYRAIPPSTSGAVATDVSGRIPLIRAMIFASSSGRYRAFERIRVKIGVRAFERFARCSAVPEG